MLAPIFVDDSCKLIHLIDTDSFTGKFLMTAICDKFLWLVNNIFFYYLDTMLTSF